MKKTNVITFAASVMILLALTACSGGQTQGEVSAQTSKVEAESSSEAEAEASHESSTGRIYLYGERHGAKKILDGELLLWDGYYNKEGMRHLFVEFPGADQAKVFGDDFPWNRCGASVFLHGGTFFTAAERPESGGFGAVSAGAGEHGTGVILL